MLRRWHRHHGARGHGKILRRLDGLGVGAYCAPIGEIFLAAGVPYCIHGILVCRKVPDLLLDQRRENFSRGQALWTSVVEHALDGLGKVVRAPGVGICCCCSPNGIEWYGNEGEVVLNARFPHCFFRKMLVRRKVPEFLRSDRRAHLPQSQALRSGFFEHHLDRLVQGL